MNSPQDLLIKQQVLALFEGIHPLTDALKEAIIQHSHVIEVDKKVRLLDIGHVSKTIYFIAQGGIRTFYIDKEGNDTTSWFLFENELAISVYSFFGQRPGFEAMETLEASTILTLSHDKLSALYRTYPEFNFIGRTLTEQYYIRSEEKANALRMLDARERYLDLLEKRPYLFQRVSLGHIASFLGINQSTLSRIRASI